MLHPPSHGLFIRLERPFLLSRSLNAFLLESLVRRRRPRYPCLMALLASTKARDVMIPALDPDPEKDFQIFCDSAS